MLLMTPFDQMLTCIRKKNQTPEYIGRLLVKLLVALLPGSH